MLKGVCVLVRSRVLNYAIVLPNAPPRVSSFCNYVLLLLLSSPSPQVLQANRELLGSRYQTDRDAPYVLLIQTPGIGPAGRGVFRARGTRRRSGWDGPRSAPLSSGSRGGAFLQANCQLLGGCYQTDRDAPYVLLIQTPGINPD